MGAIVVPGRFWRKISMRKVRILAKREKRGRKGSVRQGGNGHILAVASLRELRGEKRRGNAAPWKAWKTQKASFPLFPPGLEIQPKTSALDFHISTAPAAALYHSERTKNEPETKFQLTDRGQFRHHHKVSVASLRS
ncbi:MAG: hypothetical protein ACLQOO_22880 [Terriglobia bacterium]